MPAPRRAEPGRGEGTGTPPAFPEPSAFPPPGPEAFAVPEWTGRPEPAPGATGPETGRPRFTWEDWEKWDRWERGRTPAPRATGPDLRTRLRRLAPRAVAERLGRIRPPVRTAAVAVCLVLGLGLLGGAAAGTWLTGGSGERSADESRFDAARALWHSVPVDRIFPRTLEGEGAGPGSTDRTWVRVAVARDGDCAEAFDPLLADVLSPVGCERLLRATYVDVTGTTLTTVGVVVTRAGPAVSEELRDRFEEEGLGGRRDLIPRPYAPESSPAAGFGDRQRGSWTVRVLTDLPAVVYAVSGFTDGRVVSDRLAAEEAVAEGATETPAQAGLGHDARGVADRVTRGYRKAAETQQESLR
ncbi:hypothetical protein [Streptomyces zingiberis]|uniref:hypothetical protein n=1 Tax=Streptomyces zingiberis TaxID=2053010 RepID=UPI0023F9ECAA|nr:hypothetical protein [Streptomyces zingiberis]